METALTPLTLAELNRRITGVLAVAPGLSDVWVTAETSDLRLSGGHCYMELLQKDSAGRITARSRAVIWASAYGRIAAKFAEATGSALRSDMKIMVRANVNFHAVYGLSLVVTDIDPGYTVGDLARRRNEIIARLKADGVIDLNRTLGWADTPCRVAVISAPGAAGYGDFMKHLHLNPSRFRFTTRLFPASMQGAQAVPDIIAALEEVMTRLECFDCVVIIRGGGAGSDLACFDDYDLASNVAQFPLPVVIGIGHERDITVLDYVANSRVKTPTAAAELLIGRMADAYGRMLATGRDIMNTVLERLSGESRQLAYWEGNLPALVRNVLDREHRRTGPDIAMAIATAARAILRRHADRLHATGEILEALSPEATLRRGYSITRINGRAVTDSNSLAPGDVISTTFASGTDLDSRIIQR
ncbi:MAG: exodeoxyribonuclease VII large subunit [Muribaculaceae bacterium]|nr:exodeoxyribonuclease VII large subunit [Muribaculaceae bacterium]